MKKVVRARKGSGFSSEDALIIHSFLEKHFPGGMLDAKSVLLVATPKESPIHKYFCWDDSRAAQLYRLVQARNLINCLIVEIDGGEAREYTVPVVVAGGSRKYVEVSVARKDSSIWEQVLLSAMREAKAWQARYTHLKELKKISVAISVTEKKLMEQGVISNEDRE